MEAALDDPEVAGVIICSATSHRRSHERGLRPAKPCSAKTDRSQPGAACARRRRVDGAPFLLGFNRRFDPNIVALKRQLDSGALGAVESLHIVNHDPAAPSPHFIPTSGGLFKDFTIHDLDLAAWLLPSPIVGVFATASCLVDPEIGRLGDVDTARTVLKTAAGQICVISNTRRSGYGYDQRVEAYCAKGMVEVGNAAIDTTESFTDTGAAAAPIFAHFTTRYAGSYRAEMDHFADMLRTGAAPRVSYRDGLNALILAEACAASAAKSEMVTL